MDISGRCGQDFRYTDNFHDWGGLAGSGSRGVFRIAPGLLANTVKAFAKSAFFFERFGLGNKLSVEQADGDGDEKQSGVGGDFRIGGGFGVGLLLSTRSTGSTKSTKRLWRVL